MRLTAEEAAQTSELKFQTEDLRAHRHLAGLNLKSSILDHLILPVLCGELVLALLQNAFRPLRNAVVDCDLATTTLSKAFSFNVSL